MRGSILDIFFLGVFCITIVIVGFIIYNLTDTAATMCENAATSIGAPAHASIACTQARLAAQNFVNIIPVIVFFLGLGIVIAAAFLPISPLYLPLGIVGMLVSVIVFFNVQQAITSVLGSSYFLPLVAQFPLPTAIAENAVLIVAAFGTLTLIVMYSRFRSGSGGGRGMNKLLPILFLALFLSTSNATWTAYQEVANMSKNYSTTQGNPWYYKYFISDQVRTDMTQSCSGTSGSNYQCWRSGYSAQTSISLFPTTYNMSMQVGAAAGNPFPNLAFIYYLTQDGNYTINGSAWGYSGIASGDGMNYTILVNDVVTCSGTLTISKSQTDFNCELGKELITGTKIEFDIGSNAGSSFDYGNFTATIYASLGSKDLPPVEILLPANNTQNTTLTQPIKYSPRLANDIMSASVWYNGSGWSELISNTSNVNNNEANWLYPVFPA